MGVNFSYKFVAARSPAASMKLLLLLNE